MPESLMSELSQMPWTGEEDSDTDCMATAANSCFRSCWVTIPRSSKQDQGALQDGAEPMKHEIQPPRRHHLGSQARETLKWLEYACRVFGP